MPFTLSQAATAARRSRSTILRAIQTGRLSAVRDATTGSWAIEPAELFRAYPVADRHGEGGAEHPALHQTEGGVDATALIAAKDALIAEQRAVIDDLRRRLDRADERLTTLLTDQRAAPAAPPRRWLPWRR